jgi:hypothetical protein
LGNAARYFRRKIDFSGLSSTNRADRAPSIPVERLARVGKNVRPHLSRILALAIMLGVWWATTLPAPALAERRSVAAKFQFTATELRPVSVDGFKYQRTVEPRLAKLRTWISGVGAAIALTDLQGVGTARDLCWVDPRTDTVTITPAPGTPPVYQPFAVDPAPLPYSRATMAPTGCLPGDLNEDGWTDLLLYYWGRSPVVLLRDPSALLSATAFRPVELVPRVERWYTDSIDSADVDGDGHPDLIVGNYFPDGSRLLDATATDDPAFQMNDSMSRAYNGGTNHILLWAPPASSGGVAYREAQGVFTKDVAHAWTLAVGAQDLNGDGLPELYFANDFGPDRLMVNQSTPGNVRLTEVRGAKDFTTPKSKVLGYDSFKGMGVDFGDLNGDARPDMFVSNISSVHGLMETNFAWINTGGPAAAGNAAPFTDRSDRLGVARTGWGWDTKIDDFVNDGRPEIVQATGFAYGRDNLWPQVAELAMENDGLVRDPEYWMQQTSGWGLAGTDRPVFLAPDGDRYVNVGDQLALHRQGITRAIATGDVDGDGRLDLAIAGQWGASYFYRNSSPATGQALELRLLRPVGAAGPLTVRAGADGDALRGVPEIGARVTITLPDGRRYTAQVDGGNGHASVRSPVLHFGLGDVADQARIRVVVDWRSTDGTQRSQNFEVSPGRWSVLLG